MTYITQAYIWVAARFVLGFMLLWAFFDKLLGLGFSTTPTHAWIHGGSPTTGFLKFGVSGPLSGLFHLLGGHALVDWIFMLGLLLIGLCLVLGVGLRIAGWSGVLLVVLMWLSLLPSQNNPLIDEHIAYAILFAGLGSGEIKAGEVWGFGKWWKRTRFVRNHPIFE